MPLKDFETSHPNGLSLALIRSFHEAILVRALSLSFGRVHDSDVELCVPEIFGPGARRCDSVIHPFDVFPLIRSRSIDVFLRFSVAFVSSFPQLETLSCARA